MLGRCLIHLTSCILPRSFHSPSEEEVLITRMLDKILRRSDAIDKESLCIVAGQRVSSAFTLVFAMSTESLAGLAPAADSSLSC